MKIFITGHKGFIGSHLVKALEKKDIIITGYDLKDGDDIRDYERLRNSMKGSDIVIHLAAFVSVPGSWNNPSECFDHNVNGTVNVLRSSIDNGVKGVIYASSAAIYDPHSSPYALSKSINESIFKTFSHKIDSIGLRFFNIYGPGQNSEYSGVIPIFIDNIKRNGEVNIFGDGKQTRDFIHVSDVVDAIIQASELEFGMRSGAIALDIGTGNSVTIVDLARMLANIMESSLIVSYLDAKKEVHFSEADTSLAEFIMKFKAKIDLQKGLKRFLKGN